MEIYEKKSSPATETTNTTYDVVEKVEYGDGIRMFLKGHPFPLEGLPTVEAVQAINVVKKMLTFQPIKAAEIAIEPYILKPEYMHPCARELRKIFPSRIGQLVSHVVEYDSAYRLRLQDLFSESTKESLSRRPIREILRLLAINKRRDYVDAHAKVKKAAYLLILGLLWPPFHKSFRKSIKRSNYDNLKLNEADKYWLMHRNDYKGAT